ncbi:hypothetical protein ACVJGD_007866 [Bradyrhizobium sp. USDA 10063]
MRLAEFEAEWGKRYLAIGQIWRNAWEHVVPFFAFAPGIRKMIYATNEMDKRFLHDRDDDCGNRCKSILLFGCAAGHSSVPAIDLAAAARRGCQGWPTGPSTAACWQWNGTAFLACWNLPSAAIMVVGLG